MYDVCIIGAGVSGIFLAYTLSKRNNLKVLLIEKGKNFSDRICPIEINKTDKCINCKTCSRLEGFGGLGRSEGKFNYTNDFGGKLGEKIGDYNTLELMKKVDDILCSFGGDKIKLYNTQNEYLKKLSIENNFELLTTKTRHLGTKLSYEIIEKIYLYLKNKIDIFCQTEVTSITKTDNTFILHTKNIDFKSKKVVLATGSSGKNLFKKYCNDFKISSNKTRVDIGLRIETNKKELAPLLVHAKELKIKYTCDDYEAFTYCMNPHGKIIRKYQDNMVMADGQNQIETNTPSSNLNFTVFVPRYFNSKEDTNSYLKDILNSINRGKDRIVIQRLADLLNNKSTIESDLNNNTVTPTLDANVTNLYKEVPKIYIDGALKIIDCIESMTKKKLNRDTLLYGVDIKLYEPEINTNLFFESNQKGLYFIGDCSGTTYSLSQAAASGIYLANHFINTI